MVMLVNSMKVNNVKDPKVRASFGRDNHVLQVIPDRYPATVCRNSKFNSRIATWNVRTMYQSGKMDNIIMELKRMKISILGVCEVRWKKSGKVTSEGTTFIYSGGMEHEHGVGIFFDESTAKCVSGFWCLSERVMVVSLKGRPFDISLIQCYAPTADNNDDEIDKFYEQLDEAIKQCRSQDIRIIMGDFNAKVGGQRDGRAVGPFGLGQRNERGSRLVEWCTANRFVITNTWFQHHMKNLYTWRSPGDTCKNQIDYVMINERFRNAIKGVRTYPGADCDSDHNLLMSKLCINLRKLKRSKVKPKMKWNALLEDTELKAKFCQKVEEQYKNCGHATEKCKTLQKALVNSAQECIPKYGMTAKKKIVAVACTITLCTATDALQLANITMTCKHLIFVQRYEL